MMDFNVFKIAVAKQFAFMSSKSKLFRVDVDNIDDYLWNVYLTSFPEGTNPIYRERSEHDCSTCRHFIRAVGNVVAIIDNKLVSIWDINIPSEPAYQVVANALSNAVKKFKISNAFVHYEKVAGVDKNFMELGDGGTKKWDHFFVNIPAEYVKKDSGTYLNDIRTKVQVFSRGLTELTTDSLETVLELIAQNSLYRGSENKFVVSEFLKEKKKFDKIKSETEKNLFIWERGSAIHDAVARIRGSAIGTLLIDLSEGLELEDSVKKFERSIAAPSNYKRPTALVSKSMIESAKKKIQELGLMSALERRFANLQDITVNNIIFANRDAKRVMSDNVFDEITATKSSKKKMSNVEQIHIDKFISDVVPFVDSIEVMFDPSHQQNLVSLIAPTDPTSKNLFKWSNGFSWSYTGDLADSDIKRRVKDAGGSVEGVLCCRLAWDYEDDLDFHMEEPDGGHVYFGNRRQTSRCGGMLDVDANGCDGIRTDPCENIFYASERSMKEGTYYLYVNNYHRRSSGSGFSVEIEVDGTLYRFDYPQVVGTGQHVNVAEINYSRKDGFTVNGKLSNTKQSKDVWGIKTNEFHKVNVLMMSPNFWDDQKGIGNKHYFFMIDGCVNEDSARGFFNEFLSEDLSAHRKVLELIGSKMSVADTPNQLSGLGFSSTQHNSVLCKVSGKFSRIVEVTF